MKKEHAIRETRDKEEDPTGVAASRRGFPRMGGTGIAGSGGAAAGVQHHLLVTVLAVLLLLSQGVPAADAEPADAEALLFAMAEKIAGAETFSVSMDVAYDTVQDSGEKIKFTERREVLVRRPGHLRSDIRQSDGDSGGLIYDGKALTIFNTSENVYSQNGHTGNIGAGLNYAVSDLGARVPLARMLLPGFPKNLKKISSDIAYVEKNVLGEAVLHHIAGRTATVDYQYWIGEDSLPTRVVLTYREEPGEPESRTDFSAWNLAPEIPDGAFVFSPPDGAEKIPHILPVRMTPAAGEEAAAASQEKGGA